MPRVLIVGSSVAGVRTAQSLRAEGFDGQIVLVGEETELPYDKPELSKRLLEGTISERDNLLLSEEDATAARIELRLGSRAESLNQLSREVTLADGSSVEYDTLVIATGARARPSPWGSVPGVHVLRTIADARAIARDIIPGGHLVIIGGGFIGSEVASTAIRLGMAVDIVDPRAVPMGKALGEEIGAMVGDLHRRNSVQVHFGNGATAITSDPMRRGPLDRSALLVRLEDGTLLRADTVVVGIGALPNTEWLDGSGLTLDSGVVCDQYLRAEDSDSIYAVGDVARWWHPRHAASVRVEHWTAAIEQARAAAFNITHPEAKRPFSPIEYIWSDQHGWRFQFAGRTGGKSFVTVLDPVDDARFAVLYSDDDITYSGAMTANWPRALVLARQLVGSGMTLVGVQERLESALNALTIGASDIGVA